MNIISRKSLFTFAITCILFVANGFSSLEKLAKLSRQIRADKEEMIEQEIRNMVADYKKMGEKQPEDIQNFENLLRNYVDSCQKISPAEHFRQTHGASPSEQTPFDLYIDLVGRQEKSEEESDGESSE